MEKLDFSKYSEHQLRQILTRIDRERFPERVEEIHARLAQLQADGPALADIEAAAAHEGPAVIAGLWRRVGACVIDWLAIALIGYCLGLLLAAQFEAIGAWGPLVGFAITLAYFSIMESHLFQGHTLGKMALDIRVISTSGGSLSISRSLLRAGVFHAPYFMSGVNMEMGIAALALHVAIGYLLLFNRRTRQSLHDFVVGAVVVRSDGSGAPKLPALWRGHLAALGALGVLLIGGHLYAYSSLGSSGLLPLVAVQQRVEQLPGVRSVNVVEGAAFMSSGESVRTMAVQAIVAPKSGDAKTLALRIAAIALPSAPAQHSEVLSVTVMHGYDIGIASRWNLTRFNASPDDWREGRVVND